MFIVSMGGGLGNQMYEYAFYLSLMHRYPSVSIKLDTRYAFQQSHNGIEIFDIFAISAPQATFEEVKSLTGLYPLGGEKSLKNKVLRRVIKKLHLYPKSIWIQHDFTEYYEEIENLETDKSLYLLGPFANYKYFQKYNLAIINAFKFPEINDEKNMKYEADIKSSNSISIHLRRGDYITEGIELASDNYYKEAISIINLKVNKPKFFVFTDDIVYSKKLFSTIEGIDYVFIEGNDKKNSFRDMQLMSYCKHNIVANSTFSFWGAYLNTNKDKIVIAPNLPFTGFNNVFACDDWVVI